MYDNPNRLIGWFRPVPHIAKVEGWQAINANTPACEDVIRNWFNRKYGHELYSLLILPENEAPILAPSTKKNPPGKKNK